MTNSDRFAQIYDHLPTAGDKRLFLAGFLGAISNHLSKETMQRCIEVALKVAADSPQQRAYRGKGNPEQSTSVCHLNQGENT